MEVILKYQKMLDKLPTMAKSIMLSVILGTIFIFWYYGFWHEVQSSLFGAMDKISILEESTDKLSKRLSVIEGDIETPQKNFSNTPNMLSPNKTIEVLHDLLTSSKKLVLLKLANTEVKEVSLQAGGSRMYEHGVIIRFFGDYFSTMQYLQEVEKLEWKLFWDKLEYRVTQYPNAEVTLYLHTVSNYGDWIHV